ncbi:MAG TPA: LPS assembly protein LptD, partial [Thermoanaerobaculia bacterium]|nr:LPS assembly protein LptD [Thermoanaerobaculia bacterium]
IDAEPGTAEAPQQPGLERRPPETIEEQGPEGTAVEPDAEPAAAGEEAAPVEPEGEPTSSAPDDRPAFQFPVPEEEGGGTITGRAEELELVREDYAAAIGRVEIQYQDVEVSADRLELDIADNVVNAFGNVVIDQGPRRITAAQAIYDLDTKTGEFLEANAFVAPDYYFSGRLVEKIAEDVYTVEDGVFTSCEGESPAWSFRLARARVEAEGYAYVRHASMRVKEVPVLYTPYIVWPAKSERTSGFLIPEIGYSERRGAELGLAWFQTLGRSYDTTFHVDTYSEGYLGLGNELRYRPSEGTQGSLIGYVVRDPEGEAQPGLSEWRWKVDWLHDTTDLPFGLRGFISYHDFSDFDFFRDFERDFDRNTIRSLESRGFLSGNWGPHSLNVLVLDQETFFGPAVGGNPERTISQTKLPEIEYRLRPTRVAGLPVYVEALSSLSYLSLDRQRNYNDSYGRFDLFPQVTVPLSPVPWLSAEVSGGGRFTFYSNSILSDAELAALPDEVRLDPSFSRFRGETLTRAVPFAGAEIIGPSFSRIFDAEVGGFARFKHVIEPRLTMSWLGDFEEAANVPNFDEVDNLRRTVSGFGLGSTQSARWSLVNRLLAKPGGEEGGSAREILSFEVGQEVSFDEDQPLQVSRLGDDAQEGPLQALLRFAPSLGTNVKLQADYSGFFSNLVSTSLSGSHTFGRGAAAASWFTRWDPETGESRADQVRLFAGYDLLPRRLRLDAHVNYDLELSLLQQQGYVLSWTSQCYAVRLEMRDFRAGDRRDTEFFFTLSLKNVGTFLPLTARSTTMLP